MLKVGKDRADKLGLVPNRISWVEGDAQKLPFEDESFDAYTIAYGIRNVVRIEKVLKINFEPRDIIIFSNMLCMCLYILQALKEAFRVLRPGGRFLCLEFSHVENPLLGSLYDTYSFQVIPPMGKVLAGDWESYAYLVESIRKFPKQEEFKEMIEEAGFRATSYENLTFGVSAIHSGFKL